jgi:hypothetical protein
MMADVTVGVGEWLRTVRQTVYLSFLWTILFYSSGNNLLTLKLLRCSP